MRAILAYASLAILLLVGPVSRASANDVFYVIIFGSEDDPKHLKYSHTFATFIRATGEGCDPSNYAVSAHTLSWFPASLNVSVLRRQPERGVNLGLDETFRLVMSRGEAVTAWGPYRIGPELYNRSVAMYGKLERGEVLYRAIDGTVYDVSDCIHTISDLDPQFGRTFYGLDRIGKPASAFIAEQIVTRSAYDQSLTDNSWLFQRLGLTRYPIEYVGNRGPARVREYELRSIRSEFRNLLPRFH